MSTKTNKIAVLGLDNAGKTSLIRKLVDKKFSEYIPRTHGIEVTEFTINSQEIELPILFIDVGGLKVFQITLWSELVASDIKAVIYILDAQKMETNDSDFNAFNIVVNHTSAPILVLGNKYDEFEEKNFQINKSQLFSILDIVEISIHDPFREIVVLPISVKTGLNLDLILDWLFKILTKKKN